jgi:cytochrome c-type biogenesis protein CcmE
MKVSPNTFRIGIAVVVILGTIGWLAYTGYGSSKSYFVKVPELLSMGNQVYTRNLRVDGFVEPGSIERNGPHVDFVLNEYESHMPNAASGRTLKVSYKGSEPPPDTFKDDSEAVADGTYGRDGVFHATALQAKCASKYAPAQPGAQPGAQPSAPASAKPSSASNPAPAPSSATQTAAN